MTRVVLVSGKGGVGKTTVSAATAVAAAARGHRTLVASLDRAHNLRAVLGLPRADDLAPVPGVGGLSVLEVDPQVELRRQWDDLGAYLGRLLEWLGVPGAVADEVAVLPGIEELVVLARVIDLAESGDWDLLVVDLAPTASSLRYLSFPDLMAGPFGRLARMERGFLAVARPALRRLSSAPLPEDAFYAALERLAERFARLRDLLTDPARTTVRLVAIPEAVVIDETREALTALGLFGLTTDAVVLNRVLPEDALRGYLAAWAAVQRRELDRAAQGFADLPRMALRFQPSEVIGVPALREVARELYGDLDPAARLRGEPPLRFERDGDAVVLVLALSPDVPPDALDLRRRDRELILTVGRWRRAVTLPASLRAVPVRRARFTGGALRVEFAEEAP